MKPTDTTPFKSKGGIYVHIPFCRSKCIYCDFFSGNLKIADWGLFTEALIEEFKERIEELEVSPDTLYIGGGTPSLIPEPYFARLAKEIRIQTGKNSFKEFTLEVNPEDVTESKCRLWKSEGVNRISMGVQTFNDEELTTIRRNHNSEESLKAYALLREHFQNISIDLMFGLPGQTLKSFTESLETAVGLRPEHLSFYSLMLEQGTVLNTLVETGRIRIPDTQTNVEMFIALSEKLESEGYTRYEISNYSLSGKRSVHNTSYWLGTPYLGIGPSAHSYDGKAARRANQVDIKGYIERFSLCGRQSEKPFYNEEGLSAEELKDEYVMLRMRMMEGLNLDEFATKFGEKQLARMLGYAKRHIESGLLIEEGNSLRLSKDGIMTADYIITDLMR